MLDSIGFVWSAHDAAWDANFRRMCARVGHDVLDLVRVRIGTLDLGDLPPAHCRPLTRGQVLNLESVP